MLSCLGFTDGQNLESKLLKGYSYFVETNLEKGESTKYSLENGLVAAKETFKNDTLQCRIELEYDKYNNLTKETETYNIKKGYVNNILYSSPKITSAVDFYDFLTKDKQLEEDENSNKLELQYRNSRKLEDQEPFILGSGVPLDLPIADIKHEFDENGNLIELHRSTYYKGYNTRYRKASSVTKYKYDNMSNIIQIHREYTPKMEFPIEYKDGQFLCENEYFRYTYNDQSLWTKKYRTVNEKEALIAKREYK